MRRLYFFHKYYPYERYVDYVVKEDLPIGETPQKNSGVVFNDELYHVDDIIYISDSDRVDVILYPRVE